MRSSWGGFPVHYLGFSLLSGGFCLLFVKFSLSLLVLLFEAALKKLDQFVTDKLGTNMEFLYQDTVHLARRGCRLEPQIREDQFGL